MKHIVESKLSNGLLNVWREFLVPRPAIQNKLWGSEQPSGFVTHMITMTVYKDLEEIGYQAVLDKVDVGFRIMAKTFAHNARIIRKELFVWAKTQIILDSAETWNAAKHLLPKKAGLEKVNLLMNSSDFRLPGRASVLKKDPSWSHKLNAPGQRYQLIQDASARV